MSEEKVKQKLREYLLSGGLNGLAEHIMADLGDEEAQLIQQKVSQLFNTKKDGNSVDANSVDADSADAKALGDSQTQDSD